VLLVVTAWALVVGASFQMVYRGTVGPPFYLIFDIAFPFAFGVLGATFATILELFARRPLRPLAYFNFSAAVVLAFRTFGIVNKAFNP
jgi:hypothetical protein